MPSDKPRVTLRLDNTDMECLEIWAKEEFLTVPQLTRIVVKRGIAEYLKQHPLEAVKTNPEPKPTTAKPATKAVAKRGRPKGAK